MKNLISITLTALITAVLYVSCAYDNDLYMPGYGVDEGNLTFHYEVAGEMPETRAVSAVNNETLMRKIHVLFFDTEDEERIVAYAVTEVATNRNTLSFDVPASLAENHDYRVLAIGNADSFSSGSSMSEKISNFMARGEVYEDIVNDLSATYSKPMTSELESLPLWGHYVDEQRNEKIFRFHKDDDDNEVVDDKGSFFLSRAVCRVDLHNLVANVLDIKCARVINARNAGFYFNERSNAGSIPEFTPTVADRDGYMPITEEAESTKPTQKIEHSLYCFPNAVTTSTVNDDLTTALMIAGYYIDPATGERDSELTYYRFNLANPGKSQVLRRNYCYKAIIKGVNRRGKNTEKEAYDENRPIFDYDIDEEWETTDDNVVSDDEGNFLIVNRAHFTFPGKVADADLMELRVSTNPELEWSLEWVDKEGNANSYFEATKLSDEAVRFAPLYDNDTDYYRHGYLQIVAVNTKTFKKLYMPVYLTQLSSKFNAKVLTVDGNTGTFDIAVNPMGEEISLNVVSGSAINTWTATFADITASQWPDGKQPSSQTMTGANSLFSVRVPSNATGATRKFTVVFSLNEPGFNDDGSKIVKDVVVNFIQEDAKRKMNIINFPESGSMTIECLDLTSGNGNGVVNPTGFIVKLTNPDYRYEVTSSFDKYRDLRLGTSNLTGSVTATHPADGTECHNDKISDARSGSLFYINPFRMGPQDPDITGTITVRAYHPTDPTQPEEKQTFTVTLKAHDVLINDILVKNGDDYILVADRNVGTPTRKLGNTEYIAELYDSRSYFHIYGKEDAINHTEMIGLLQSYSGRWLPSGMEWGSSSNIDNVLLSRWQTDNKHVNAVYAQPSLWYVPTTAAIEKVGYKRVWSKMRTFLVSDIKKDGKEVCCWMPNMATSLYIEYANTSAITPVYITSYKPYTKPYSDYAQLWLWNMSGGGNGLYEYAASFTGATRFSYTAGCRLFATIATDADKQTMRDEGYEL